MTSLTNYCISNLKVTYKTNINQVQNTKKTAGQSEMLKQNVEHFPLIHRTISTESYCIPGN